MEGGLPDVTVLHDDTPIDAIQFFMDNGNSQNGIASPTHFLQAINRIPVFLRSRRASDSSRESAFVIREGSSRVQGFNAQGSLLREDNSKRTL